MIKKKFSDGRKGSKNGMFGKNHTAEAKAKMGKNYRDFSSISGSRSYRARKVRCINTGEVFQTLNDAISKYPTATHISECISGIRTHAGYLDNNRKSGEHLFWEQC